MLALAGCGTTRSTDSLRTATEQLLISDAIDRAVQTIDFAPLRGQTVYLDDSKLEDVVDKNYLVSTLRQHILASGCTLKNNRNEADFIVEARAGAVGTDRNDLLFGIPATNVPQIVPLQGVPAAIPEVPLAKRLDQRGVAKISMFAYHRESGRPVWQSGLASRESSSNDVWLFGAGPFQYGSVLHQHPERTSSHSGEVSTERDAEPHRDGAKVKLAEQVVFASPEKLAKQYRRLPAAEAVAAAEPKPTAAASCCRPQPASASVGLQSKAEVAQLPLRRSRTSTDADRPAADRRDHRCRTLEERRTENGRAAAPRARRRLDRPAPAAIRLALNCAQKAIAPSSATCRRLRSDARPLIIDFDRLRQIRVAAVVLFRNLASGRC